MMKKHKLIFLPLSIALLSSCSLGGLTIGSSQDSESESVSVSESSSAMTLDDIAFESLNWQLSQPYTRCNISVQTTKDDMSLTSTYYVTVSHNSYHVSYSKEEYVTIDLDNLALPESNKKVTTGEYDLTENEFTLSKYVGTKVDFDSFFFTTTRFEGRIRNAKSFLKTDYNVNNLALNIDFSANIEKIELKYSLDDQTVVMMTYTPSF